jgi:hypothetical protein
MSASKSEWELKPMGFVWRRLLLQRCSPGPRDKSEDGKELSPNELWGLPVHQEAAVSNEREDMFKDVLAGLGLWKLCVGRGDVRGLDLLGSVGEGGVCGFGVGEKGK